MKWKRLAASFGRGMMLAMALLTMIATVACVAVGSFAVFGMVTGKTIEWWIPAACFALAVLGFATMYTIIENA